MDGPAGQPRVIDVGETARLLSLPEEGVRALAAAGYLRAVDGTSSSQFALGDVKAFLARMGDGGTPADLFDDDVPDPAALLDALDERTDDMAQRAFDIFQQAFPDAAGWPQADRQRFIDQAKHRFEAILAIAEHGEDAQLVGELQHIGASAALAGSSLPQLLLVLRISRDLVVQTAVEHAEERGPQWGIAVSLLLTQVLPAVDRLTDAIAQGYWAAMVRAEEETRARHESVVEAASDGVYELDLDGRIRYANPSLAVILGVRLDELEGALLGDVLVPVDGTIHGLTSGDTSHRVELTVRRTDGVQRNLDILAVPRRHGDDIAGYQGIVRDLTAVTEIEGQKNEFLALITEDLRHPLATILGLGVTLEGYAEELPVERVRNIGRAIRRQSERISRLSDDLADVSRIAGEALLLSSRPVDVEAVVASALFSVDGSDKVDIVVPSGLEVQADPRRLEQVVANLVENALRHGEPPVRVEARAAGDAVEVAVSDGGRGVSSEVLPTLFSRLRIGGGRKAVGLSLVRGVVEAMGGRVWYERDGERSVFRLSLPTPRRHVS